MKWKRVKGTHVVKDKVSGQVKPVTSMTPAVTYDVERDCSDMRSVEGSDDHCEEYSSGL
ncbi:hypothetical protein DPMN_076930 [Dreissena polymorpha]|uniref:Uncharacterized protein n=2 Tax=Dreissena polymorpha TaxID=45954 RepID=A0A9D3YN08_DREPO|nr:hypothetical protein DPMN_076930 [Dreissena polymorpha]